RQGKLPELEVVRAARVLLDEAEQGDRLARRLVAENGALVADYAAVGARRVGLDHVFPVVLAGGVFAHGSRLLEEAIASRLASACPQARVERAPLPPVGGALIAALAGLPERALVEARARIAATLPHELVPQRVAGDAIWAPAVAG